VGQRNVLTCEALADDRDALRVVGAAGVGTREHLGERRVRLHVGAVGLGELLRELLAAVHEQELGGPHEPR
jgi:hypothetical protein